MNCETPGIATPFAYVSEDRPPRWIKPVLQSLLMMLLSVGAYQFVSHYFYQSIEVVGVSMEPTLRPADHLILNRFAYQFHEPKPLDIVVLKDPTDGAFVVKRIIAQPGDVVRFRNGMVFVNDVPLSEPYIRKGSPTWTGVHEAEELIVCGNDQYFVLGDNREHSFDSRMYGPVRRQNILGLVSL